MMPSAAPSLCLLLNARAAGDEQLRAVVESLREAGRRVEVRALWEPGQAEQFAADAVSRGGFEAIIACGGDGTLNEVVNGVMAASPDAPPAVGVLPYGTANDFAIGIGMPADDPAGALHLIASATPQPIDLGQANDRWFINAASVGLNAEVTADTPGPLKQLLGGTAYSLNALSKLATDTHRPATVTADAALNWQGDLLMLIVANARTAGGGYAIAPHAQLDDGLLDVTLVANTSAGELVKALTHALTTGDPDHPAVIQQQVRSLDLATEQPITLNLDGETMSHRRCRFTVRPQALRVLMPPRER